jgi:radical SAM superfamily enzyme YgiQ (UPF0313 family)
MRILLIAPRNPESFWTWDRILPTIGTRCFFPNLSLPTVAALTPPEHEVVCCDENVEPIDFDAEADIVGVTGYVVHLRRVLEIVDELKRRGRFVVVGGPVASLCPERFRDRADVVFIDEAEETWPRFLRDRAEGRWQHEYRMEEKPSLENAPLPRFDLLKLDRYRTMTVQFARGCPYSCEFCDIIAMYGRRPRSKTVEQLMREVAELARLGVRNVFIVDDNFIGDKKKAKALLRTLAAWQAEHGYPLEFFTELSLNVAQDAELLELLRAARFTTVFIGIESPRAASLQETKKTQNLREDMVAAVHRVQEAGIEVMAGMIVGFDHDDAEIFDEHLRFIEEARLPVAMTVMLNAMPRTPLYERVKREGRLLAESVGDCFTLTNIVPQRMSLLALYEGYQRLLRTLYDYDTYRRRAMALVLAKGRDVRTRSLAGWRDLPLFFRLLWTCVLGASRDYRRMTLAMMGETARRRPEHLRLAAALALKHKHLHGYVQDVSAQLDGAIAELRRASEGAGALRQAVS